MSHPSGTQPCSRIHSRSKRLIRFRTGAFPTFLVTVRPNRPARSAADRRRASARTCRPCSLIPSVCTATNSERCRNRISLEMPSDTSLLGSRDRDPLASLCATTPQHFASATRLLARTESVRALAALVVRLIGAFHVKSPPEVGVSGAESILNGGREVKPKRVTVTRRTRALPPRFPTKFRSSLVHVLGLQPKIWFCYQRQVSSAVDTRWLQRGKRTSRSCG